MQVGPSPGLGLVSVPLGSESRRSQRLFGRNCFVQSPGAADLATDPEDHFATDPEGHFATDRADFATDRAAGAR